MEEHVSQRRDGSFIVRIWWEQGEHEAAGHWRGWVQHVRDGRHLYFTNLRDMAEFIERETGIRVAEERAGGLV
jgi:hypothetical protein